jgi:hypothetical protein
MSMNTTTRTADTTRMIATFDSLSAKRKIRHYPTSTSRQTFACDGRTVSAIYVSADDPKYTTCSRCAKLAQPVENPNASIDAAIARLAEAIENPNTVAGLDAHDSYIMLTALIDARVILMTRRIQGAN